MTTSIESINQDIDQAVKLEQWCSRLPEGMRLLLKPGGLFLLVHEEFSEKQGGQVQDFITYLEVTGGAVEVYDYEEDTFSEGPWFGYRVTGWRQ